MAVKTYNPDEVAIIVGGFIVEGYADGQFINIVPNADLYELTIGTDGEGTRSAQNNKSAQITIDLLQSSESNSVLDAFAKSEEVFPLLVKDNSGNSLYTAVTAWVRRRPDATFDRTVQSRSWTLETDELIAVEAGN